MSIINSATSDKTTVLPLLSICLATFNRGKYIAETLDSILLQMDDKVELVIVDGASTDQTKSIVCEYLLRNSRIRYFREDTNSGVDCDYDKAVGYAHGKYCWLMPDDDLLTEGAIEKLMRVLEFDRDLVVVNSECWNADFSQNLHTKMLQMGGDKTYVAGQGAEILAELSTCLSYIGSVVVKRSKWLGRDRISYYGSLFIHVGVIFQHPPLDNVSVIVDPLIRIRYGNGMWSPRSFEIWYFKWPALIWSFSDFSKTEKQKAVSLEPWRRPLSLFKSRAVGDFTRAGYKKFLADMPFDFDKFTACLISFFPPKLANTLCMFYYSFFNRSGRYALFDMLRSHNSTFIGRSITKLFGIEVI